MPPMKVPGFQQVAVSKTDPGLPPLPVPGGINPKGSPQHDRMLREEAAYKAAQQKRLPDIILREEAERVPVINPATDAPPIDQPRVMTVRDAMDAALAIPNAPPITHATAKKFLEDHQAKTGAPLMLAPLTVRAAQGQPPLPSDKAIVLMPPAPALPAPAMEPGGEPSRLLEEGSGKRGTNLWVWLGAYYLWQRGRKAS